MELDLELSMQRLKDAGFIVTSSAQALNEIAAANQTSSKQVYGIQSSGNSVFLTTVFSAKEDCTRNTPGRLVSRLCTRI